MFGPVFDVLSTRGRSIQQLARPLSVLAILRSAACTPAQHNTTLVMQQHVKENNHYRNEVKRESKASMCGIIYWYKYEPSYVQMILDRTIRSEQCVMHNDKKDAEIIDDS